MKKFLTIIAVLCAAFSTKAQAVEGWPSDFGGVMFQAFYWDSYSDTQWTNLTSQADELAKYYKLVWVPQSGWCNGMTQMGYADIYWLDQHSAFGTEAELKKMISTFKDKGISTIADVVINHKNGKSTWVDFPNETYKSTTTPGKTYTLTWSNPLADICTGDDGGKTANAGYKVCGAADTGDDFDGARDLDHTKTEVQNNIKTYLDFLLNEMGYSGFRYDMTGGYAPKYTKMYNESAKPAYSVGEYWRSDGLLGLQNWVNNTGKTSAAFDFQLKWLINTAFNNSKWSALANYTSQSLIGSGYAQYAVTFTDNHDTYRNSNNMLRNNIEAANAYILTMPGTPCIFMNHWKAYRKPIKKMILARKLAGITNTSSVTSSKGENAGYSVTVRGDKGSVLLCLGTTTVSTSGYQLAVEGTNYKMYVSNGIDISSISAVDNEEETKVTLPACATKITGAKYYCYFEKPSNWKATIYVWPWSENGTTVNVYTSWPGSTADVTKVGTNPATGNAVYLWKYNGTKTVTKIIFNEGNGGSQTADFDFKNGNYYTGSGYYGNVEETPTGISNIKSNAATSSEDTWYSISGMRLSEKPVQKGIYIHNGKKIAVR